MTARALGFLPALVVLGCATALADEGELVVHEDSSTSFNFIEAQKACEKGDWREALAKYQMLLGSDLPGDLVVRLAVPGQIVGIQENARRELAHAPEEAKALYQQAYGAAAAEAFAAARKADDAVALWAAARRFPLAAEAAAAGAEAAARLFPAAAPGDTPGFGVPPADAPPVRPVAPGEYSAWTFTDAAAPPPTGPGTPSLWDQIPLRAGDLVVIHTGSDVAALRSTTGTASWSVRAEPIEEGTGGPAAGRVDLGGGERASLALLAPACAGGQVVAVLEPRPAREDPARSLMPQQVVSVAARDGSVRWRTPAGAFGAPNRAAAAFLYSPPLAWGTRVYVAVLLAARLPGPFDPALACLDAATGKVLWTTTVPHRPPDAESFTSQGLPLVRATALAVHGGRIYFPTHRRSFAALDAVTGEVLWAHDFAALPVLGRARDGFAPTNPVVVADGVVVTAPCDTPNLVAYDEESGRWKWAFSRDTGTPRVPGANEPGLAYLVGIRAGRVFLTGSQAAAVELKSGRCLWRKAMATAGPIGRGFLAEDVLLACGPNGYARLDLDTGAAAKGAGGAEPASYKWIGPVRFGSVHPLGDLLLVASPGRVWCFRPVTPGDDETVELVARLGSPRWSEREEATQRLVGLGPKAAAVLKDALADPDAEIAWRAERILGAIQTGARLVGN